MFGQELCCLSGYCQQLHNTLSILQYLYEQIQIIPPHFYLHSQADVAPQLTNNSVPCLDANICRRPPITARPTTWEQNRDSKTMIIEAKSWENVNTANVSWLLWKYFMALWTLRMYIIHYTGSNPSLGTKVWFSGSKFLHACVKTLPKMLFEQDLENLTVDICQNFEDHENISTFCWSLSKLHLFVPAFVSNFRRFHVSGNVFFFTKLR